MPTAKRERQRTQRQKRQTRQRRKDQLVGLRRRVVTIVTLAVIAVLAYLIILAVSGDESASEGIFTQEVACGADRPDPPMEMRFDQAADMQLDPESTITAILATSCGDVTVLLNQSGAPATANSFVFLAREGYYDGTPFHRIIQELMVQGGDPTGSGTGGPGYRIPDERPPGDFVYEPGVVAMANSGPGSTGSQFFIVSGPDGSLLEPSFNVLGRVIAGMEAVDRIAAIAVVPGPTGERTRPSATAFVESIEVITGS